MTATVVQSKGNWWPEYDGDLCLLHADDICTAVGAGMGRSAQLRRH